MHFFSVWKSIPLSLVIKDKKALKMHELHVLVRDSVLKIENNASIAEAKNILKIIIDRISIHASYRSVRFIVDVDPV